MISEEITLGLLQAGGPRKLWRGLLDVREALGGDAAATIQLLIEHLMF
jgi:hypothetical protein